MAFFWGALHDFCEQQAGAAQFLVLAGAEPCTLRLLLEKAASNGTGSRKAKLQQDLIEEQSSRKQDVCVCLSDFLQEHLSLSNIPASLRQII